MSYFTLLMTLSQCMVMTAFLLAGLMKITPFISLEVYEMLNDKFETSFIPLYSSILREQFDLNVKIDVQTFKLSLGVIEVILALLLVLPSKFAKKFAAFSLMIISLGATFTHIAIEEDHAFPLILALLCLFILLFSSPDKHKQRKRT